MAHEATNLLADGDIARQVAALQRLATRLSDSDPRSQTGGQWFAALLEAAPDATLVTNSAGEILLSNKKAERLFGYARMELQGRPAEALIPQRLQQVHRRERLDFVHRPAARPMGAGMDLFARRKDGSEFPVEITLSPLPTDEGTLVINGIRDVTDRKRVERALPESEEHWRLTLDRAADGIFLLDSEFRHIYVNDAACELLATSREEILGRTAEDLFADGPAPLAELAAARAELRTCGVTHHILRFSRADGSVVLLDAHTVALPGGTYHSIVRDVTALKETEKALRRSETTLANAVRLARLGTWEISVATQTIHWSDELYRIIGRDREQFQPTLANDEYLHPEDCERAMEYRQLILAEGGYHECEYRILQADGTQRHMHVAGTTFLDDSGAPVRVFGTVQDVTEQREAEAERRKLEAQVALAQRLESLGRLAGGMAHDFNNLLAVVLASLDMAALDASAASREAIDQAREAARSAAELCRQLLLVGRSTVGVPEPQSVAMLVRNAERLLARTLAAGITVRHDIPNGLSVLGNGPQLEGALFNLALNARDAMPDGGTLHLRARLVHGLPDAVALEPCDDGYVLIEVEDTGFGMDEETVARMFDPFFTTKADGTGLGAAAVYGIVRDHGGSVTVDSAVGRGTTVRVFLPPAPADSQPPENDPDETGLVETGTVLVVDDMEPVRRTVQGILERAGFTTMAAASGDEALARLRQEGDSVNAVVLDCMLPDLTGRAVFDALRGQGQAVPVLFISGYASDTLDELEPDGGWAFLQKPFDADSLLAALTALIGRATTAPLQGDA